MVAQNYYGSSIEDIGAQFEVRDNQDLADVCAEELAENGQYPYSLGGELNPYPCGPPPFVFTWDVVVPGDGQWGSIGELWEQVNASATGGMNYVYPICPKGFAINSAQPNPDPYCWRDVIGDACPLQTGEPIGAGTGSSTESQQDIPASGGTLGFGRHYNSQHPYNSDIGSNWTHTYSGSVSYVSNISGETAILLRPNAKKYYFRLSGGNWENVSGVNGSFELTGSGYRYTTASNTVEEYDASGRLVLLTEVNGTTKALNYDSVSGALLRVEDSAGDFLAFGYDAEGYINTITDSAARQWGYRYDASGNLEFIDYPDGLTRQYHYNEPIYTSNTNIPHALTGITDERDVRYATWEYDTEGRAVASYNAGNVQRVDIVYGAGGQRTVTNSLAQSTTYNTSVQLGIALPSSITGSGCSSCGTTGSATYSYDPVNNNLLSKTENGVTTEYGNYDSKGQYGYKIEAKNTPEERRTDYSYDSRFFNKITSISEPSVFAGSSKITTYTYDDFGNRLTETVSGFTPAGNPISRTTTWQYNGPLNQLSQVDGPRTDISDLTHYRYYANDAAQGNNRARLKEIEDANGVLIRSDIQYSATGKVLSEQRPNGMALSYTYYPGNDRLEALTESNGATSRVSKWTYLATGEVETITTGFGSPAATTLILAYDDARRLTRITDGLGNYIEYTLDTEGNRVDEKTYDNAGGLKKQLTQTFDIYNRLDSSAQANESTDYTFAPDGTLDRHADGRGGITDYSYDSLQRLTQAVQDQNGTDPETADNITGYSYDVADRLTSVTDPISGTTTYVYDDLGNLLSQTSPDSGTTAFSYDAAGNLKTKTDAKGQLITYSYDALNRLTTLDVPGVGDDISYAYDTCANGSGRLCVVTLGPATAAPVVTGYSYTALGDVASHQGVGYTYDDAGRLQTMTYPSGAVVTYQYDAAGQVGQVGLTLNGQARTLAGNLQYQPFGPLRTAQLGNGLDLSRVFDTAYRFDSADWNGLLSLDYSFDANGNLLNLLDSLDAANDHSFAYDALNRLTTATRSGGAVVGQPGDPGSPGPLFSGEPAVLTTLQTMNNESANPPASASTPWLTPAARNLSAGSIHLALERAEVATGSVAGPETVGVVAIASGALGSFTANDGQSVSYEATVSADSIRGWGTCTTTPLVNGYSTPPLAVASPATHDGGDGGWVRRCSSTTAAIGLTYDEDTYNDTERNHTTERASILAFSRPFDAAVSDYDGSTWHLEAGEVTLNDTTVNPAFVAVSFQQSYPVPPVVLVLPTSEGSQPAALRVRNVTSTGFELSQVEPDDNDGIAPPMTVPYIVIEPGVHQLPDGNWLYADQISVDDVQHGAGLIGAEGWYTLTFPERPGTPTPPVIARPGSQALDYDANGNRTLLTEDASPTASSYAANSNRLSSIGSDSVTLDANGNITAIGNRGFVHNAHNRITEALDGATSLATYRYNGLGQRVQKDTGAVTVFAYGTEGQLLGDYQDDGTTIREYVYLNGEPIAQINGEGPTAEVLYLHTDHLGTPRRATDAAGIAVWAWDSDAFGAVAANEDFDGDGTSVTVPVRFPGQYYDQETGLHYNYFRYYDPQTGRYLTSDPIGLNAGTNTYTYVENRPLYWVDPFGLDSISLGFGGAFHYGPLGASASSSLGIDGNGKVCFQFTKCGQIGFGLQGGLSGGVNVSESNFCEGDSSSEGVFADGALGFGLGGSISNDENGNTSAAGAKGIVGAGAAAGKQFCTTRTVCLN